MSTAAASGPATIGVPTSFRHVGIANVHCAICAATLEETIRGLPGVTHARVSLDSGEVAVRFDPRVTSEPELIDALANGGFEISSAV
ncbi:MAG TPA: heavy metal-associated domain-containing protein [Actinomycetota bacterium]|nr:heavy metal-associated domain-containing protein [Actinomycetota bacterium]